MMVKESTIAIVTIDDYINYGNRLQNYALTTLLKNEGYNVVNGVRVYTKEEWIIRTNGKIKKMVKRMIPFALIKNKVVRVVPKRQGLLQKREEKFVDFINGYTTLLEPVVEKKNRDAYKVLKKTEIEYAIAGSDQVWNPCYEAKGYEFISFMPAKRRLSFAASIGVENILEDDKEYFKKRLLEMKYLSVREERAAQIIRELTGREADITLDPTLLLEKEEWEKIVRKPQIDIKDKYICTYFLGEIPDAVRIFAQEKAMAVYCLNNEQDPELFTIDPAEFLYMIKNAEYVLTDSFHAVAFSIKFNKEFYVFNREQKGVSNMFSRIETITKRFKLENRIQSREKIIEQSCITQWDEINQELKLEKDRSMGKLMNEMI